MIPVELKILGKRYFFKSDNPEKLKENAKYLEAKLEELKERFNTVDQKKIFVLFSLNLIEQYFSEKEDKEKLEIELEQINELLGEVEIEK